MQNNTCQVTANMLQSHLHHLNLDPLPPSLGHHNPSGSRRPRLGDRTWYTSISAPCHTSTKPSFIVLAPNPTQASAVLTPKVLKTPIIQTMKSPSPTPLATYLTQPHSTPHTSLQTKTQNPIPDAENLVLRNRQYGGYGSYPTITSARSTTTPLEPKPAATSSSKASSNGGSTGSTGGSGGGSTSSVDDRNNDKGLSTEAKIGIAVGVPTFLGFFVAIWMFWKSRD